MSRSCVTACVCVSNGRIRQGTVRAELCVHTKSKEQESRGVTNEANRGFMEATKTATPPEKVIRQAIECLRQKIRVQIVYKDNQSVEG